jgi:hypothetical protein
MVGYFYFGGFLHVYMFVDVLPDKGFFFVLLPLFDLFMVFLLIS